MRDAGVGLAQTVNLFSGGMDHVRVPDIVANPAEVFGQLDRRAAKGLLAVGFFVARLGQVGMRVDMHAARQCKALAHEVGRDGEGRAGREHDTQHAVASGVVVRLDQAARVAQDRLLILDDAIRWQAAFGFANGHRAARGVEAEAQLARRLDLVVEPGAVGPEVGVVAGGRAAGEHQLGDGDARTDGDGLGGHASPDGVVDAQPGEEVGVLRGGEVAGEGLVEVVVGVDQPRQDHHVAGIDDGVRLLR